MKRALRALALPCAALLSSACSWLTDFRQQPSVGPWQSLTVDWSDTSKPSRGNPQGSVPTTGTAVARYQVSYTKLPNTVDSMSYLKNPEPATQASVDRGWKYFQVNCSVCHGNGGAGDGLAQHPPFNVPAPSLLTDAVKARSDGYIFGQIRNGGTLMPTMNRVPEQDRWHVINYVRGLQGRLPADIVIRRDPPGRPGVTGDSLPGATLQGPERSVPFVKPSYVPTPPATGRSGEAGRGGGAKQ
jgi:mono/diheme cytochrome c family protein